MADKYGNPWPKYRVYLPKTLPPLRALRAYCLDCNCESAEEVRLCPAEGCPLWPFRFGAYPNDHQGSKSVLRPIKVKCKDCAPEPQDGVRNCAKKCCPLWPYRQGHNPARAGQGPKGGNPGFIKREEKGKLPDSRPSNQPKNSDEECGEGSGLF
jgi:hypothetical protein